MFFCNVEAYYKFCRLQSKLFSSVRQLRRGHLSEDNYKEWKKELIPLLQKRYYIFWETL